MYSVTQIISVVPYLLGISLAWSDFCPNKTDPKYCLLRTNYYEQKLWGHWSGFYCYHFTNPARLYFKYPVVEFNIKCGNIYYELPVAQVDNATVTFFDYTNKTSLEIIKNSFKTSAGFQNFRKCCEEARDCCSNHMNNNIIQSNTTHCPAVWDGWSCFPPTRVNSTARLPCSSQAYSSPDQICKLESEKQCLWNRNISEWDVQTDYNTCAIAPVYHRRHIYHIISLGICTVWCFPAIIIFLLFQKLRKTIRVILHRNLLIAICIRNILTIVSKYIVILDALKPSIETRHIMENNGFGCRVLSFFENSAKNCIYGCMLLDGFYLHKVIVRTFAREIRIEIFYIVLSALTFLPSIIWATCLGVAGVKSCWVIDSNGLQWIVDSFRIVILAINIIFLLDIVRVMLLKLKRKSTTKQTMAAFRATLFLFPLFGIHILVTANKIVYDDSCTAEDVYDYARYTMEAIQGIIVAVLFCYANSEVHEELHNGYRKLSISVQQRFGIRLTKSDNRRRPTTMTFVQPEELSTRC